MWNIASIIVSLGLSVALEGLFLILVVPVRHVSGVCVCVRVVKCSIHTKPPGGTKIKLLSRTHGRLMNK